MAKTLSPHGFKDMLEAVEISVGHSMPDSYDERYTTAELLDAESALESALVAKLNPQVDAKRAPNLREVLSAAVDAIDAMPPASRQAATYEFFQTLDHKTSARATVQSFIELNDLKFVGIGEREFDLATQAYAEFGKGRHPAALNMGDCFAYACAKANRAKLLFKGEDFPKTDITSNG